MGERVEIIEKDTSKVLARGNIISKKDTDGVNMDMKLISLDWKYYFNPFSENFVIRITDSSDDVEYAPSYRQKIVPWGSKKHEANVDIYRENDISELDEEVKDLVFEINKWPGVQTWQSCSGHDRTPLWVTCMFTKYNTLLFFITLMTSYNKGLLNKFKLDITSSSTFSGSDTMTGSKEFADMAAALYGGSKTPIRNFLQITIATTEIGEKAYDAAKLFTNTLKELREGIIHVDVSSRTIQ